MIGQQYDIVVIDEACEGVPSVLNVYYSSGATVYETESTRWKSDGNGGVYTEQKEPDDDDDDDDNGGGDDGNNYPPLGTDLGVDPNDSCYNLIADGNGGATQQSNGSCDDNGNNNPPSGTNLGVDPNDSCYDLIADGSGGTTQQPNGSCDDNGGGGDDNGGGGDTGGGGDDNGGGPDYPAEGTNLGVDPNDSCYDLIANGSGGTTQVSNGSCDGGGGDDNGGGGDDNGGGGGGDEGEEETLVDPQHAENGQFEDVTISANWNGEHPRTPEGELHMVQLNPQSGLWEAILT